MKLRIKHYRKRIGYSQKMLANKSKISRSYIAQLESNNNCKSPTLATLEAIANALEICPILLLSPNCNDCTFVNNNGKIHCKNFLHDEMKDIIEFLE